jgi:glucosamine kinase
VIVGTGTIGWAELNGRSYRVGGWGLPISDEGSGAWLGCEALRRALWAYDGRIPKTALSRRLLEDFQSPHHILRWITTALPRDFGSLAPIVVDHAMRGDPIAMELMDLAADHVDRLADRLIALGVERLSLFGGLAPHIEYRLGQGSRDHLVSPIGDALQGAIQLARRAAQSLAA